MSPLELYEQCLASDKRACATDLAALLGILFRELFFGQSLFIADPQLDSAVQTDPESAHSKILAAIGDGAKYRDLIGLMKKTRNKKIRLLVLAMWLKSEDVCEPEEFLPFSLRAFAKRYFRGLSLADIRYASLVDIWRPYFKRLMDDLRALPQNFQLVTEQPEKRSYETKAILCAQGKKSPIPAICEWLAPRESVNAMAIRNAYSRCCSIARKFASAQVSQIPP